MPDNQITDGLDANVNLLYTDSQAHNQAHNAIASAPHPHNVGNYNDNVFHNIADVGEQLANVQGPDIEENPDAVGIHPNLPRDILAVDTMSRAELVAALEVLSATNLPAEAVCIDVEIVEAIITATVTFLHHNHTQCIHIDKATGERCTAHA
ncbi:hypothetical protein B0T13DRAFT_516293 [Neurospora crassa]|nr:hypothetical protein B0T13DRAFT_516293 [Neurospora crassa]